MSLEKKHREAKLALARAMVELHRASVEFHRLLGGAGDGALADAYAFIVNWVELMHGRLHGLLLSLRILELMDKHGKGVSRSAVEKLFGEP